MAISIFDFNFRFTKNGSEFFSWDQITPSFAFDEEKSFFELFVPTKETIKYEFMISKAVHVLNPIFLTGVTGTGKTMIINNTLAKLQKGKEILAHSMTFSANASSFNVQVSIENKDGLQTSRKRGQYSLLPPPG